MALRPYTTADRDACLALFASNVPDYFAQIELDDFVDTLDHCEHYFVIEQEGEGIVACGGYDALDQPLGAAGLCWGMVRRDLHGRGLGERLLRERLRRIDADPALAQVLIETTQRTRDFFTRHGFAVTRTVADGFAPGYDLVEMVRPAAQR